MKSLKSITDEWLNTTCWGSRLFGMHNKKMYRILSKTFQYSKKGFVKKNKRNV